MATKKVAAKKTAECGWWFPWWFLIEGEPIWSVLWVDPVILLDVRKMLREKLGKRLLAVEEISGVPPLTSKEVLAGARNFVRIPKRKASQRRRMPPLEPMIGVQ